MVDGFLTVVTGTCIVLKIVFERPGPNLFMGVVRGARCVHGWYDSTFEVVLMLGKWWVVLEHVSVLVRENGKAVVGGILVAWLVRGRACGFGVVV